MELGHGGHAEVISVSRWFQSAKWCIRPAFQVAGGKVNDFTALDRRDWVLCLERNPPAR